MRAAANGHILGVIINLLRQVAPWILRAAHDIGLAAWFGGAYFGAVSLNGASREVEDPTQRSRVANAGWFRWAAIVPVAIGAHLIGGVGLLAHQDHDDSGTERTVALLRAGVLGTAMLATLESGRLGRKVAAAGDVPVATAVRPIADTPAEVASCQRRLRVLQWVIPAATASLVVIDAWQSSRSGTRPAPRDWLRGR